MSSCTSTRRDFVKGVAAVAGAAAVGAAGVASADEAAVAAVDWLGSAPSISDADCVETVDVDVVVVGGGTAGFFAACAAAEEGVKTLLIEKNVAVVGIRGMLSSVGNKLHKKYGVEIDKMKIVNDMARYSLNNADMRLLKLWADKSGEAVDWYIDLLEKNGIFVELEYNKTAEETYYTDYATSIYTTEDDAAAITAMMCDYLAACGGELRLETSLQSLIREDGRVVGIYATNANEEFIRINASKGVVLATGGYARNIPMFKALHASTFRGLAGALAFPSATGDGIRAALWEGAQLDDVRTAMVFDRSMVKPEDSVGDFVNGTSSYHRITSQPWLKTDVHGERFTNESSPYDFTIHGASHNEGRCFYAYWDANWKENVERFHTTSCSTIPLREGGFQGFPAFMQGIDNVETILEERVELGFIQKADSIEELAAKLGVDPDGLRATVDRYNELYDKQCDEDFGKEPFRLSELRTAPFYGAKVGGTLLCTLDGLCVNTSMQVLDEDNRPIEGLYAVGNDGGCYHAGTYANLVAGNNAGRCATFGRIAGKVLAK